MFEGDRALEEMARRVANLETLSAMRFRLHGSGWFRESDGLRRGAVPKICEFFGISIYMYFREHPPPHSHARYAGSEVVVSIQDLSVMEGGLSPRALGLVMEWASLHEEELVEAWRRAQSHEPPGKVDPLS